MNTPLFAVFLVSAFALINQATAANNPQNANQAVLDDYLSHQFTVSAASGAEDQRSIEIVDGKISGTEMFNRGAFAFVGLEKIPYILFRLLPELAQAVEGKPVFGSSPAGFENFGVFMDNRKPDWPVPLGFTWTVPAAGQEEVSYMIRTCANCHVGRIESNGEIVLLEGAPNHEYDFHAFTTTWLRFVDQWFNPANTDQRAQATAVLRKLLNEKKPSWYYNNQQSYDFRGQAVLFDDAVAEKQIALLADNLADIMTKVYEVNRFRLSINQGIDAAFHADGVTNPQSIEFGPRGIADSNSNGIHSFVAALNALQAEKGDPLFPLDSLFKGSTKVAIPSVWQQQRRHAAQWTASVISPLFRNVIAAAGFGASPGTLNALNLQIVTEYISKLPPPPFPGEIDPVLAEKGKQVYEAARCQSCHVADHDDLLTEGKIPPVFNIGTNTNRAFSSTPGLGPVVVGAVLAICTENPRNASLTVSIDGKSVQPCSVDPKTDLIVSRDAATGTGYPAMPLDGVWARAPYLNNGSIPTLFHLLASKNDQSLRPAKFSTGSISYDTAQLGWQWDHESTDTTTAYNTALDGFSNHGHDGFANGGMWTDASDPTGNTRFKLSWDINDPVEKAQLDSLLEYLKTL